MGKTPAPNTPWIEFWTLKEQACLRLFCFPFAGSGASIYRKYSDQLPDKIEVWPVQLPGRESRLAEEPISNLHELIDTLQHVLHPYLDVPYAFFGHSMGALICFELARVLCRRNDTQAPIHLFVSGHRAPQLPPAIPPVHHMPDPVLLERLHQLGGTPQKVLEHPKMQRMILRPLRADFALCETYMYIPDAPFNCPLSAFGGLQDEEIPFHAVQAWKEQTSGPFKTHFFVGNHFFLLKEEANLLDILARELLCHQAS